MFGRIAYHLLPRDRDRGAHLVPTYIIDAMARVLPISRSELMRAAAEASGYEVATAGEDDEISPNDVVLLVTRTIEGAGDEAERDRIGLEVIDAITRAMRRRPESEDEQRATE